MKGTPPHLKALEEIEHEGISGLVEVLREEGVDGVRHAFSGTRPAGTATTLLPPGATEPRLSRSVSDGRWR